MKRFRWWLARLIAPSPIIADPFPGYEGVVIRYQKGPVVWAMCADRFRMKASHHVEPFQLDGNVAAYTPSKPVLRFVGTVAPR